MMFVVSTAYKSRNESACRESVQRQTHKKAEHIWIEASKQSPPRCALQNRWEFYQTLDSGDVIVELDGDDMLAHPRVLEAVARWYEDPDVWISYGSFVHCDGRPGFCGPYAEGESFRTSPWRASHLKSFRAGLFQRVPREEFRGPRGDFSEHARDLVTMIPMLELAGPARIRYCPEILYLYDLSTSYEWNTDAEGLAYEWKCVEWVRARRPLERLASL
jgi:hypothetical protein